MFETDPSQPTPATGRFVAGPDGAEHKLPVRVYYEDTDFSGVVYHARYLQFLERGRSDFLRCAGVTHVRLLERDDPLVFAVHHMELTFHRAARVDDALVVATQFLSLTGARIRAAQKLFRESELMVSARIDIACMTPEGRPKRAPGDLSAALGPYLASQAAT